MSNERTIDSVLEDYQMGRIAVHDAFLQVMTLVRDELAATNKSASIEYKSLKDELEQLKQTTKPAKH